MHSIGQFIGEHKGFVAFFAGVVLVRSTVVDWYSVPSGSMLPTLLVGDRVVSNRLAYDFKLPFTDVIITHLAEPQRGDIVTFISPDDGVRLVKRIIGVPGDVVEMRDDVLIVNGERASYDEVQTPQIFVGEHQRQVTVTERILGHQRVIMLQPKRVAVRSFVPAKVPAGQYLVLGDNRDNSKDSRYVGFVRRELLTGQVTRVLFSLDPDHFYSPRFTRWDMVLH